MTKSMNLIHYSGIRTKKTTNEQLRLLAMHMLVRLIMLNMMLEIAKVDLKDFQSLLVITTGVRNIQKIDCLKVGQAH